MTADTTTDQVLPCPWDAWLVPWEQHLDALEAHAGDPSTVPPAAPPVRALPEVPPRLPMLERLRAAEARRVAVAAVLVARGDGTDPEGGPVWGRGDG